MFNTINEALESERFPTDGEIENMKYGVKYFSFRASTTNYTRERQDKLTQMQQRLNELEQEKND